MGDASGLLRGPPSRNRLFVAVEGGFCYGFQRGLKCLGGKAGGFLVPSPVAGVYANPPSLVLTLGTSAVDCAGGSVADRSRRGLRGQKRARFRSWPLASRSVDKRRVFRRVSAWSPLCVCARVCARTARQRVAAGGLLAPSQPARDRARSWRPPRRSDHRCRGKVDGRRLGTRFCRIWTPTYGRTGHHASRDMHFVFVRLMRGAACGTKGTLCRTP